MSTLVQRLVLAVAVIAVATSTTSPLAADTRTAAESSQCLKAKRRIALEEKREAKGEAAIDGVRQARESCSTASACARYDAKIRAMETRKEHHDTRLARFKAAAAKACQNF